MNVPETFFSTSEEIFLFGISCLFGVIIGVCYDVFRTARILFPHNTVLVVIEDVVFMAGYAVFLSSFATVCARGELRFYYIVGNAIGFIVYFFTLGSVVIGTMKKIYFFVIKILGIIFRPFRSVYVNLQEKADKFVGSSKNSVKRNKKSSFLLLNPTRLLYNRKENKKRKNVNSVAEKDKGKDKSKIKAKKPV
ncbi:MAG: spore cortex biosynthesis protein YabQ [Ruminococcus sp.]|nr:spore cortex biosynthesis protein YabQ [Ruminococcus sp.]MDE6678664.1 spore cortex biosynthesis protein YabQ [Ruminococcus sp.]